MLFVILPFGKKAKEFRQAKEDLENGRLEEARKKFRRLKQPQGLVDIGREYLRQNRYRRALELFEEGGNSAGMREVAEKFLEMGNYGEWERAAHRLTDPVPKETYVRVGCHFFNEGDLKSAEKAFLSAENHEWLHHLAEAYLQRNDLSNAVRLYRRLDAAADLDAVAETYLETQKLDLAEKLFTETGNDAGRQRVAEERRRRASDEP
ncbi:MAG: hypothetical protein JXQ27_16585 [Acidobacteria bacterium]|nr:hypothetical protein [Acidobacteriota bacterium]